MRILKRELWPHKVTIDITTSNVIIEEVEQWLGDNVGGFKNHWNTVYKFSSTDYYFKDERHQFLFILRWL